LLQLGLELRLRSRLKFLLESIVAVLKLGLLGLVLLHLGMASF
jgi:hypothetical protein